MLSQCRNTVDFSIKIEKNAPDHCGLVELSVMMEILHVCPVHYGSHWPRVATEHVNVANMTHKLNL